MIRYIIKKMVDKPVIKKIKKIKNLGIFKDYSWDSSLQEFERYNLIYGWNGSGKTTLSNLFAVLEAGSSGKYSNLKYEIETQTGNFKQGDALNQKVRVFNRDYISNNVQTLQGKAKLIYILGEENKKIAEEIDRDLRLLTEKREEHKKVGEEKVAQEKQRNKQFTDIARTISSNISGEATRKYDKRDAEDVFKKIANKELLEELEIEKHNLTLKQLEKPILNELVITKLICQGENLDLMEAINRIICQGKNLCSQTVESVIIERLRQNSDISEWVEKGIVLHQHHTSKVCEFCNQALPISRIQELTNYFNEADKKLKDTISVWVEESKGVSSSIESIKPVDKANLYEEMQDAYQSAIQIFEIAKSNLLKKIVNLIELLNEKKSKTTESVKLEFSIDTTPFIGVIDKINIEIRKHNTKTNNFKTEKKDAQKQLEKHYLSSIYDDVKGLEIRIKDNEDKLNKLERGELQNPNDIGIGKLAARIADNKSKISSSHKACEEINSGLKTFLGRDELRFEVDKEGYVIKRRSEVALDLSEGERTAIAFVYFTIHLKDQDFDITKSIVVVDDPVLSLDSNSLFQAFVFLKNAVKNAHQVFVLTHNFDFLRLLLNWVRNIPNREGEKSYCMIHNSLDNTGNRKADIRILDKILQEYESEYHFLFKMLKNFQSDGTIMSVYYVPNIARKVLETFLMFRVPNNESCYDKLETLRYKFDGNKLTAIYKFTNDQSHITGKGFDPSLVSETQNNVVWLLEMIEAVFPEHYKILIDSI